MKCSQLLSCGCLLLAGLIAMPQQAHAQATPGAPCAMVGVTQLSDDQVSLVACLKKTTTDATLVWKSMTPVLSHTSNVQSTLTTQSGVPALVLKTEGTATGIGPTLAGLFGPNDGSGSPGALYIGTGRKGSNGTRNDIALYNYACTGGTCDVPNIYLYADLVQASHGIRVGTTGTACTGLIGGTIRYNPPNMEYCDGTTGAWKPFGGASGTAIPMYQCPVMGGGSLGGGLWGYYGCLGQISNVSWCFTVEWPWQYSANCTYVGHMMLQP